MKGLNKMWIGYGLLVQIIQIRFYDDDAKQKGNRQTSELL